MAPRCRAQAPRGRVDRAGRVGRIPSVSRAGSLETGP